MLVRTAHLSGAAAGRRRLRRSRQERGRRGGLSEAPIALAIAGLGMAGAVMVRAAAAHPGVKLVTVAEPNAETRNAFARDFDTPAYAHLQELCDDPRIEAVYVATPHQFHAPHAKALAEAGKHIILEKPMALTLADCDAIIEAVERANVHLIVGHTHAFDPAVREMARIVASGELGPLGMVAAFNYTNFLYRPRRPEELDTAQGGGILFNQLPHQIDIVRTIGGGRLRSVRAQATRLDPSRPTEGSAAAFLEFENGAAASLVYGGYDFFDSDELHDWISERGADKPPDQQGAARRALEARAADESRLRVERYAYGSPEGPPPAHQPHFGVIVVTCARGEMRASADGLFIYDLNGKRELALPKSNAMPGRSEVLDDMIAAIRQGKKPRHDGRWGKANVEVTLAILRSARERREIMLEHQTGAA
ncbi:MAG: Gfo/Idh/MocA family oxidoreductase [Xanthobacteraceae bacterium]